MSELPEQTEIEVPGCLRFFLGTCVGILPGVVILIYASRGQAIAVMVLGGLLGVLFCYKGGIADLFKATAALLIHYNIPLIGDLHERRNRNGVSPSPNHVERLEHSTEADNAAVESPATIVPGTGIAGLNHEASDTSNDETAESTQTCVPVGKVGTPVRLWIMAMGVLLGMFAGALITAYDVRSVGPRRSGFLLPLSGTQDSLLVQAIVLTAIMGTWCGTVAGVLSSPAVRPLAACWIGVFLFASGIIGIAVSDQGYPWRLPFMGATLGAFMTLLTACCSDRNEQRS